MKLTRKITIRSMEPADFVELCELSNRNWTTRETAQLVTLTPELLIENLLQGIHYDLAIDLGLDDNDLDRIFNNQTKAQNESLDGNLDTCQFCQDDYSMFDQSDNQNIYSQVDSQAFHKIGNFIDRTVENSLNHPKQEKSAISPSSKICGFILFQDKYPYKAGQQVLSFSLLVDRAHRRQGIARQLVNQLIHKARLDGYRKLSIDVLSTNPEAISFYENLGFIREGVLKAEFTQEDGSFVDKYYYSYFL